MEEALNYLTIAENSEYFYRSQPLEFGQFLLMSGAEQIQLHLQQRQEGKPEDLTLVLGSQWRKWSWKAFPNTRV